MIQFSFVFSQWCFLQKKHIFQCGECKMQTLDCSPGVIIQTKRVKCQLKCYSNCMLAVNKPTLLRLQEVRVCSLV